MIDYEFIIELCQKLCLELTRVNNETFGKEDENNFDFSLWFQDNKICEIKIYYTGFWDCSIFTFSYSCVPCIYLNHDEIQRQDFVLGGSVMEIMQYILEALKSLNKRRIE